MKIKKIILDILYPINCVGCGQEGIILCDQCFKQILINKDLFASQIGVNQIREGNNYLDGFLVASDWQNKVLQEVIHKFKYDFIKELAVPLSKILIAKINWLAKNFIDLSSFVVVPVPLHRRRLAWRGFNQAELLASALAKEFNFKLDNNLIKRKRYTSSQAKLKSAPRNKNVLGAFKIISSSLPKNILLVDDVITTGATMNEIAKVFKKNGVSKIWGLAVANG